MCDSSHIPPCIFSLFSFRYRAFLQDFIFIPSCIVEIHNFIPCLLCIFHELCVFSSLAASVIIATSSRDGQPQTSISCSVPKVRILPFFSFLPKTHDGGYAAVWPGCRVFFFFQKKNAESQHDSAFLFYRSNAMIPASYG